ncbi:hypothetical protein UK23_26085 [Lentzea aerocolonigenes]|uniref:Uncharacterized protein n=1 Tax=Lentzea aerocolonigenes TaxID=68170 RepID=A0A0F0GVM9_LENAE|nr:alpha/beta hydrolase [Lentzea aerocolonigenes]KJK45463.1 hypothetical protein UK23_26085 [Lentzea aerocolonigenes]
MSAIAAYLRDSYCDWLPLAQSLADAGHQVLLFELGDPRMSKDEHKYDLDVRAAAQELTRRGATSILAGGEVPTAAGAVPAAPRIQGLAGLVLVTPVRNLGGYERSSIRDVKPVLESLTVPVLIAASDTPSVNGDPSSADVARDLASAAADPRLDLVSGSSLGVFLVKADVGLRDRIVSFAGEVQAKPWYERYMWLMTGGVLVLGLLGSLLVFRRRHNREVPDDRG